jgi:aryl-alcohol dehydrogenase-like predicted oxidoreductase
MRYKPLGTPGVRISEMALGTMTFGDDWGWGQLRPWMSALVRWRRFVRSRRPHSAGQ